MLRRLGITLFFFGSISLQVGCSLKANVVDKNSIDGGGDQAVSAKLVVSKHKFSVVGQFSYVDLAVDWNRNLAYLASRKPNVCVDVIDFTDAENPTLVGSIGSATFQQCVGVKLFDNNTKLVLSSSASKKIAVWSLGLNPTFSSGWFKMGEATLGGPGGRRIGEITQTGAGTFSFIVAVDNGVKQLTMAVTGGTVILNIANSFSSPKSHNSAVEIGNDILLQSFDGTNASITHLDSAFANSSADLTGFWGWSALANEGKNKAFLGGNGGMFFSYDGVSTTIVNRFKLPFGAIRGGAFAIHGSSEHFYSANSSGIIDMYDVTDMGNVRRIKTGSLGTFDGELYSIQVKPEFSLAVAITNQGDFIILNLDALTETTEQFPADL